MQGDPLKKVNVYLRSSYQKSVIHMIHFLKWITFGAMPAYLI